jgi:hypothetical protein
LAPHYGKKNIISSTSWEKHGWQHILGKNMISSTIGKNMIHSTFWEKNMIDSTFWEKKHNWQHILWEKHDWQHILGKKNIIGSKFLGKT